MMIDRTTSSMSDMLMDPRFELGRIINVYPERGTVDWRSEMSEQYRNDIPYVMPYFDQSQGTGIYFNPEVGTTAICCTTSDGLPMIFGFIGVDEGGSYLSGRPRGNPGDITLTGKDGNFIQIRRGGILQIGSTALCQTVYLPIRNILQQYAENFEIYTLAGTLKFNTLRAEDSSDGHSRCQYTMGIKEYADDKDNIIDIQSGSLDNSFIFSITTKDKGGGKNKISLTIDKSGNLNLTVGNDLTAKINHDLNLKIDHDLIITTKNDITMDSQGDILLGGDTSTMKSSTLSKVSSDIKIVIDAPQIELTEGAQYPIMRYTLQMSEFFQAIATALNSLSIPVSIPIDAFNNQVKA